MRELAKVLATGRKIVVEKVGVVNKVTYYAEYGNPEKVYTNYELWFSPTIKKRKF